ncbi:uncharacterized protein LOC144425709 [Styela clava]
MHCLIGFILVFLGLISCSRASTCADGSSIKYESGTIMSPSQRDECKDKICSWRFRLIIDGYYTTNDKLLVLNISKNYGVGNSDLLWIEGEGLNYKNIDFESTSTVCLSYYISDKCLEEIKTLQWNALQVQEDIILKFKCEPSRFQFTIDYAIYPCENTCKDISISNSNGTIQSPKNKSECDQRVCTWKFSFSTYGQENTAEILILNFTGTTSAKYREMLWIETSEGYNKHINFSSDAKFVCMIYYMSHDGGFDEPNCVTQIVDTSEIYLKYMCEPSIIQFRLEYINFGNRYSGLTSEEEFIIMLTCALSGYILNMTLILFVIKNKRRQQNTQNRVIDSIGMSSNLQNTVDSVNSNEERENTSHIDNSPTSAPITPEW